jgi:hypothetical protein
LARDARQPGDQDRLAGKRQTGNNVRINHIRKCNLFNAIIPSSHQFSIAATGLAKEKEKWKTNHITDRPHTTLTYL